MAKAADRLKIFRWRHVLAKPEWGLKRNCLSCGIRFYDMQRNPIACPSCEAEFDPLALVRPRRARAAAAASQAKAKAKAAAAAAAAVPALEETSENDSSEPVTDDPLATDDDELELEEDDEILPDDDDDDDDPDVTEVLGKAKDDGTSNDI
jgi:uncharacterized protein (TIGR02300 family)